MSRGQVEGSVALPICKVQAAPLAIQEHFSNVIMPRIHGPEIGYDTYYGFRQVLFNGYWFYKNKVVNILFISN